MSNNSEQLKIGDKVQIIDYEFELDKKYIGKTGIITDTDRVHKFGSLFDYECKFPDGSAYIFAKKELKHLQIGEQLLLFEEV